MPGFGGFGGEDLSDNEKAEIQKQAQQIQKMSFEEYKEMMKKEDPESFNNMSEKELRTAYDLMQKMAEQMGN